MLSSATRTTFARFECIHLLPGRAGVFVSEQALVVRIYLINDLATECAHYPSSLFEFHTFYNRLRYVRPIKLGLVV